jgi:hemolysin activation/secretion protein
VLSAFLFPSTFRLAPLSHCAVWLVAATQAQAIAQAPAAAAAEARFDILEFQIEGNTVLDAMTIERAVMPELGPARDMAAVEAARTALEAAYQKAGFLTVLVDVPEQHVDSGIVLLSVTEGKVDRLYVTGSRYHDQGWIRAAVPELAAGKVPDFNQVQQQLASVSSDDRKVQPVLRPGQFPGTVEVDLQVDDRLPLSGSVEVNNFHSRDTEPMRLVASLRYDNLFQRDHSIALTAIGTPTQPSESQVLLANYVIPTSAVNHWAFSVVWSNSNVETLGGTQVLGNGTTIGVRRQWNFGSSGTHSLSLGVDYKNLKEKIPSSNGTISTPLQYAPLQFSYAGAWSSGSDTYLLSSGLTTAFGALLQRSVECVPGVVDDQFNCKRQGASGSFAALKFDGRWARSFGWGSAGLRFGGQLASGPLVSPEQYALGGAETVRGYLDATVLGDSAGLLSLELRSANLAPTQDSLLTNLTVLAFVDAGIAYLIEPGFGQTASVSLVGTGFGMRFAFAPQIEGGVDLGWPQKTSAVLTDTGVHVYARLVGRF